MNEEIRGGAVCDVHEEHPEMQAAVCARMPDEDTLYSLAELYKMFGDSTRIKILYALLDGELCVCDIAGALSMSMSAISHQLRVLKQARLVKYRREGKTVFYALADSHVHEILALGLEHINE